MTARLPLLAATGLSLAVLCGCGYTEGGAGRSIDSFTYVSYPHQPKTVSVIDTRTGEKVWTVEVPVGQQVVVEFKDYSGAEAKGVDEMRWELMPAGHGWGSLANRQPVPPASSRRIEMALRSSPEMPAAMKHSSASGAK